MDDVVVRDLDTEPHRAGLEPRRGLRAPAVVAACGEERGHTLLEKYPRPFSAMPFVQTRRELDKSRISRRLGGEEFYASPKVVTGSQFSGGCVRRYSWQRRR